MAVIGGGLGASAAMALAPNSKLTDAAPIRNLLVMKIVLL
jgi:hypothetical protein